MSDDGSQVSVVWEKQYYAKVAEAQEKLRPLGTVELQTQLRLPATAGGTKAWWEEPCGNPDRHAIWKEAHTLFDTRDPSWCGIASKLWDGREVVGMRRPEESLGLFQDFGDFVGYLSSWWRGNYPKSRLHHP